MLDWQGAKILVTGGAGFIGSHLVECLYRLGAQVTVVDNQTTGQTKNLGRVWNKITFYPMDLRQPSFASWLASASFDVIFHLASTAYVPPSIKDPYFDFDNNVHATIKLLEVLRTSINRKAILVMGSSAAVYGNPQKLPIAETDPLVPISPYGAGKLAMERYLSVYSQHYGIRAVALRLFSVYGPRQKKQVVYDFIRKLFANPEELEILGDGSQERDLIFVEDVAKAALVVAQRGKLKGEVYNVATGTANTTLQLAEIVAEVMHLRPRFRFTGQVRPGDPLRWQANISRIQGLGFDPAIDLREGVRRTVSWFNKQNVTARSE